MTERPDVVCICGSATFMAEMREENRELTLEGVIVLAPGEADESPTPEQKAILDPLHLRKIDLADRVLVVNPGGYVGESTQKEIAYARAAGKPVTSLIPTEPKASTRTSFISAARQLRASLGSGLDDCHGSGVGVRAGHPGQVRHWLVG